MTALGLALVAVMAGLTIWFVWANR